MWEKRKRKSSSVASFCTSGWLGPFFLPAGPYFFRFFFLLIGQNSGVSKVVSRIGIARTQLLHTQHLQPRVARKLLPEAESETLYAGLT